MRHFFADMMTEAEVEKTRARLRLVPGSPYVAGVPSPPPPHECVLHVLPDSVASNGRCRGG